MNLSKFKENIVLRGLLKALLAAQFLFLLKQLWAVIIRDYLMAFWLSPEISTQDPIISPRALARGLIMVEG